jgi:hypothetical protein
MRNAEQPKARLASMYVSDEIDRAAARANRNCGGDKTMPIVIMAFVTKAKHRYDCQRENRAGEPQKGLEHTAESGVHDSARVPGEDPHANADGTCEEDCLSHRHDAEPGGEQQSAVDVTTEHVVSQPVLPTRTGQAVVRFWRAGSCVCNSDANTPARTIRRSITAAPPAPPFRKHCRRGRLRKRIRRRGAEPAGVRRTSSSRTRTST